MVGEGEEAASEEHEVVPLVHQEDIENKGTRAQMS
jgi:hypothetical protein